MLFYPDILIIRYLKKFLEKMQPNQIIICFISRDVKKGVTAWKKQSPGSLEP